MVSNRSNGSNRGFILAVAGLALVSAAPQNSSKESGENAKTKAEISKSSPSVSPFPAKPVEVVQRPILERPCDPGSDNRQSNLCAQWKAADAAGKAALWAMIATFVTALGTFGLFWQIKLTREAVQDTGKATEAMQRQNEIAEAAQRAWVFVKSIQVLHHPEGSIIRIIFYNFGQWPAMDFAREAIARNLAYPFPAYPLEKPAREFMTFIPPNQEEVIEITDFKLETGLNVKTRVYLVWSYRIPGGTHTEHQDWVVDCENSIWAARKFVPYDSKNYRLNMQGDT